MATHTAQDHARSASPSRRPLPLIPSYNVRSSCAGIALSIVALLAVLAALLLI